MFFDFMLEEKNVIKKCGSCEYGLVKSFEVSVDKSKISIMGVCDECNQIYYSEGMIYDYKNIDFVGA